MHKPSVWLLAATLLALTVPAQAAYQFRAAKPGVQAPPGNGGANPGHALTVAAAALPDGTVDTAFSYDFTPLATSTGPAAPQNPVYTWIANSALPPGLSLTTTGLLYGTPTASGTTTFTVTADDGISTGQQSFALTVHMPPPVLLDIAGGHMGASTAPIEVLDFNPRLSINMWAFTGNYIDPNASFSVAGVVGTGLQPSTGPLPGWTGDLNLPFGMPVGCYNLTVINPGGATATLPGAVCVSQNY